MKSLSNELKEWIENNDFYSGGVLTNELKFHQRFGQRIQKITLELEYHGQNIIARQIHDSMNRLLGRCRKIDEVCRKGCRTHEEFLELDFIRSRAVGLAFELAELLEMVKVQSRPVDYIEDEWISLSEAGKILGFKPGSVSRLIDKGLINDNGLSNHDRKVSKISVLFEKERRDKIDLNKSANDLRYDSANIKNKRY